MSLKATRRKARTGRLDVVRGRGKPHRPMSESTQCSEVEKREFFAISCPSRPSRKHSKSRRWSNSSPPPPRRVTCASSLRRSDQLRSPSPVSTTGRPATRKPRDTASMNLLHLSSHHSHPSSCAKPLELRAPFATTSSMLEKLLQLRAIKSRFCII